MEKIQKSVVIVAIVAFLVIAVKLLSLSTGQLAVIAATTVLLRAIDRFVDVKKIEKK